MQDQFERVTKLADGQREFLHGVIEFYKTRADTHSTIAAERMAATGVRQNDDMHRISAWVAIIAVPTAVTGYFGQNVPYPGFSTTGGFIGADRDVERLLLVLSMDPGGRKHPNTRGQSRGRPLPRGTR